MLISFSFRISRFFLVKCRPKVSCDVSSTTSNSLKDSKQTLGSDCKVLSPYSGCCNLSGGVALIVYFTTNGMCAKNNTITHVARASNSSKDGRGESCWLHPRKSGLEVNFRPGCVITYPTLHDPISVWSQQMSQSLRKTMLYFESFQGYCQRDTMQRKSGYENEWVSETVYAITQM